MGGVVLGGQVNTSLGFLKNIYGPEHISLIPNLPRLHAIAFGKWIRSERPLVFQVPFDEAKVNPEESGAADDVPAGVAS